MATLGFQVHTDKENATPGILRPIKGQAKSVQAFPSKGSSKLTQPTPRKALGSVNNQVLPGPSSFGLKGRVANIHQGPVQSLFKSKKSVRDENFPGHFSKKSQAKGSPKIGSRKLSAGVCNSKPKPVVEPIPFVPDDVEYDSDTILPHSDRLSCYVDKLLTWRPPCLFGTASDSDIEEVSADVFKIGDIEPPSFSPFEVDDQYLPQDLSELLVDLPSLSPQHEGSGETHPRGCSPDIIPLNDQSLDSSLHLGHLRVGSVTPEPISVSNSRDSSYVE